MTSAEDTSSTPQTEKSLTTSDDLSLIKLGLTRDPGTELTNFYTPENTAFYSAYSYLPLDPRRREIRLLKVYQQRRTYAEHLAEHPHWSIHRGGTNASKPPEDAEKVMLACEIVDKVPLSRVYGRYLALSYCAGSRSNPVKILIDGLVFNVFANLYHAISCALHYSRRGAGSEVLLWVDQICINQSDDNERGMQVCLMREIYKRSDEALVCLSTMITDKPSGFKWARVLETSSLDASPSAATGKAPAYAQYPSHLKDALWENIMTTQGHVFLTQWLESLRYFVTAPWWTRSWVYQEFVMAPRVHILCGPESMPWTKLSPLLGFVLGELEARIKSWGFEISDKDMQLDFNRMLEAMQENQDLLDEKDEEMIPKLKKYRRNLYRMNEELGSRQSRRNEQKYEESHIDKLIRYKKDDLKNAPRGSAEWKKLDTQLKEMESERERKLRADEDSFNANMDAIREKWANEVLFPRSKIFTREAAKAGVAILVDGLRRVKTELRMLKAIRQARSGPQKPRELKELLRHARNCHSSDPRDKVYAFLGLAHPEYEIAPNYSWANNAVKVFIDTCQKIIEFDYNLSVLEHAALARKDLGCFLPSWVPDWTSRVDYDFRLECARVAEVNTDSSPDFMAPRTMRFRPEYRADKDGRVGHLGLKVVGVLVDVIDSFSDSALEPRSSSYESPHVQRFKTASGHKVFTGRQAQLDDEIWVVLGATWPLVLRPESDSEYIFLGEALICEKDVPLVTDIHNACFQINGVDKVKAATKDIYLV